MTLLTPTSLDAALRYRSDQPGVQVLAGGTDVMVELNFGLRRPDSVLALRRVDELRTWTQPDARHVVLGAGLTYTQLLAEPLATLLPGLAQAARTVGSPQIRNAGTIGGNLATASPAGDTLPVLSMLDAVVICRSIDRAREVSIHDFLLGPKRTALEPDELIVGVRVEVPDGPQEFLKVGTRNAMVIAVAGVALGIDHEARRVRCALGSVGPTVLRARRAEQWIAERIDWPVRSAAPHDVEQFGALVAEESQPIDDHRSTAAYRRHAVGVCARRALERTLAS